MDKDLSNDFILKIAKEKGLKVGVVQVGNVMSDDDICVNFGCGSDIREGWVNVDFFSDNPDVMVWDLNKYPLPFADGSVSKVVANHIVEHLVNPFMFVMECQRILKRGGTLEVTVPSFHCTLGHLRYYHKPSYMNGVFKNKKSIGCRPMAFELVELRKYDFKISKITGRFKDWVRSLLSAQYKWILKKK